MTLIQDMDRMKRLPDDTCMLFRWAEDGEDEIGFRACCNKCVKEQAKILNHARYLASLPTDETPQQRANRVTQEELQIKLDRLREVLLKVDTDIERQYLEHRIFLTENLVDELYFITHNQEEADEVLLEAESEQT